MEVAEALAFIQRLIEEHRIYLGEYKKIEQIASDATGLQAFDVFKEAFMPGRQDVTQVLHKLSELVTSIANGLRAHYDKEEANLPGIVQRYGDEALGLTLRSILLEHRALRQRIAQAETLVADLTGGKLNRFIWEATGHDLRAHLTQSRKVLENHAEKEQVFLYELQKALK